MTHQSTTSLIGACLIGLASVAAGPAVTSPTDWTVVAEEDCVPGPDVEEGTTPDAQDLCSMAWRTIATDDPATAEREPTTIAVRLTTVGSAEARVGPVHYSIQWAAGDCAIELTHRDAVVGAPGEDSLEAHCGAITRRCFQELPGVGLFCNDESDEQHRVEVEPPTVSGPDVTWTLTFDGELAPLATRHGPGAEVEPDRAVAGFELRVEAPTNPDLGSGTVPPIVAAACVGAVCTTPVDDVMLADRTVTIGG